MTKNKAVELGRMLVRMLLTPGLAHFVCRPEVAGLEQLSLGFLVELHLPSLGKLQEPQGFSGRVGVLRAHQSQKLDGLLELRLVCSIEEDGLLGSGLVVSTLDEYLGEAHRKDVGVGSKLSTAAIDIFCFIELSQGQVDLACQGENLDFAGTCLAGTIHSLGGPLQVFSL